MNSVNLTNLLYYKDSYQCRHYVNVINCLDVVEGHYLVIY
jgi:hypothetical protein